MASDALAELTLEEPVSNDAELLARIRRREEGSFEELIRTHQDRVYDFCVRMLGDREEAHDVVQEIFATIHKNIARFRQESRISTWIFRISKNHCINRLKYLRRRGRGLSEDYDQVSEAEWSEAAGAPMKPDEALIAARERAMVMRAIQSLEPEQRILVTLRDIEGLTYEEIVQITELPEGTVKSRLHRARERLAKVIGQLEE